VVGPWEVLLVVTVWTVSYFCLYFQAAVFLCNVAAEFVTEVCLYSVSLRQVRNFRLIARYADYMFFSCALCSDRQLSVQFFWLRRPSHLANGEILRLIYVVFM
jgi:hypothetical protein